MLHFFRLAILAIELLPAHRNPLDAFVREEVDFNVILTTAPVSYSPRICAQAFGVCAGKTCVGLSSPFPVGTFLQFATSESTRFFNLGGNANPIHVQVVAVRLMV